MEEPPPPVGGGGGGGRQELNSVPVPLNLRPTRNFSPASVSAAHLTEYKIPPTRPPTFKIFKGKPDMPFGRSDKDNKKLGKLPCVGQEILERDC